MGLVRSRATALMCGVALATIAIQNVALAQDANRSNVTLLERLVIGAGAPRIAINTPQAVTVVNQDDLDARQATSTGDIFKGVPGVTMLGSDNILGQAFNIRGIGVTENTADAARIVVNVDGVPKFNEQYRMGSFFSEPELYKQVEVLRGPASSTLYGAGAIGGVVNFVTKDASDFIKDGKTGAVRLKGSYESNGNGTLASGIWAHTVNETFDVLAAGNWRRAEDFTYAGGSVASGTDFKTLSGLVKGTARFGNNDEQKLALSYQRWQSDDPDQPYIQTSIDTSFGYVNRKVTDDTLLLTYANPDSANPWVDFNLSLAYSNTQNEQSKSTERDNLYGSMPSSFWPSLRILDETTYAYKTFQLKADNTVEYIGENFENYFTFGLQAAHQDRVADRNVTARLQQHPVGVEDKLGLFAQNEFIWDDKLTLIAGLRSDFSAISPSKNIPGALDVSNHAISPKLAALYEVNDNIGVFGSIAYTERLPTMDELYSYSANDAETTITKRMNMELRKESAINYEGGFTLSGYDLLQSGDQASVKTTAFYNDLRDMIASSGTSSSGGVPTNLYYANVDQARIYGLEVEGAYNSDVFFANLAYTATWGYDNVTKRPLKNIPAHRVVATAGARFLEHNLEIGARAKLVANSENGVGATSSKPVVTSAGYQSYDVFASWKPESGAFAGTQLQASIENVFNADYRDNLAASNSKGRTFKLTLSKQFDY
jgi:hemoglobin/transferrin/lactoferrin receptor protein